MIGIITSLQYLLFILFLNTLIIYYFIRIHRQRRQRDHLISNDNNCNQLYIYEGIIIAKNQLVMSLSDKGISGIHYDIFYHFIIVIYFHIENTI